LEAAQSPDADMSTIVTAAFDRIEDEHPELVRRFNELDSRPDAD
jgi:hypothetical protein